MKRFRVAVEEYQYYGVYVYAENEDEARKIVEDMLENDEDIEYDDEGDGETRVTDIVDEIDENGYVI